MPTVLIVGATSGIARELAAEFARHHEDVILAGRDRAELEALAADLALRYGIMARAFEFDALAMDTHQAALAACLAEAGDALEGAVVCVGYLGDQATAQSDFAEARRILDTNLTGCVSALEILARHFEARRSGFISAVSSVAGDRGRQSKYLYGSAKAGLSAYLQGLRGRLYRSGVRVLTVKPGFVDTGMIFGQPGTFLVASPERVARAIYRAIRRGKDVIYVPWFWRPVAWMLKAVPERIFKRLPL